MASVGGCVILVLKQMLLVGQTGNLVRMGRRICGLFF